MQQLYLDIIEALNGSEDLASVNKDLFKGQIAGLTGDALPAILVDFPYCYYKDTNAKIQHGYALIRIILCVDPSTLTGEHVTDAFGLKETIYTTLQGLKRVLPTTAPITSGYFPLTRGTDRTDTQYSGVYVFEIDFYTTIVDTGVYTRKNLVDATTYSSETYPLDSPPRVIDADITVDVVTDITDDE